jgi:hypothetical protein
MKTPVRSVLYATWLTAAIAGAWVLFNYESTSGNTGPTPQRWPTESRIASPGDRPVLLMFAHPHCPCTRASIGELNRLLARCRLQPLTHVLFIKPAHTSDDWLQTTSWKNAAAIPGVTVFADSAGQEAHRFGAESSGYVVLYDAAGRLVFNGGITAGRGKAGDNSGAQTIVSALSGQNPALKNTPVFGCGLREHCDSTTQ